MEKLLQLLNEYAKKNLFDRTYVKFNYKSWYFGSDDYQSDHYSFILSKKFWFIQRLDNEGKIDYAQVEDLCCRDVNLFFSNRDFFGRYKRLLMLLAIQEDPIEFLVSILK